MRKRAPLWKPLCVGVLTILPSCTGGFPSPRQADRLIDTVQGILAVRNPFLFGIAAADILTRTLWPDTRAPRPNPEGGTK